MRMSGLSSRAAFAAGAALLALAPLASPGSPAVAAAAAAGPHWTGGAPLPPAKDTTLARNEDGEPGMGVTPTGQFWIASDIAPYAADDPRIAGGLLSGADVWTSTDAGRTYRWVADPFTSNGRAGLGGEDTDLAVAPAKNSNGFYNVYVASLYVGDTTLATSTDGGKTWSLNPLAGVPSQDRPWLSADGPCTIYVSYHQLPLFTPTVTSFDTCTTATGLPVTQGVALDPVNSTELTLSSFPGLSGSFNKQVVDTSPSSKYQHSVYVPMSLCQVRMPNDIVTNATGSNCPQGTQYVVAVSRDKGQTYTYHPVVLDKSGATLVWAATVATDAAGTVYFAWSDAHNAYLNVSHDGGKTWSKTRQLNPASSAAVYPTVAAGRAGRVDVAWYGTNRKGDANDTKVMGTPGGSTSAQWVVELARSTNGGSTFTTRPVTGVIHKGVLCTHGGGCSGNGSRNLLDDFGLAISPSTGLDSVTYTSDQPDGTAGHAFTGYTSEVAPKGGAGSGGGGGGGKPGGGGNGTGPQTQPRPNLPTTGVSPLLAFAGASLLVLGLLLRRRTR